MNLVIAKCLQEVTASQLNSALASNCILMRGLVRSRIPESQLISHRDCVFHTGHPQLPIVLVCQATLDSFFVRQMVTQTLSGDCAVMLATLKRTVDPSNQEGFDVLTQSALEAWST